MKNLFAGKRLLEDKKIYIITFVSVLTGLGVSFVDTVWALYIDSFVHSVFLVGLVSALITFISFISYFFVIPLVEKNDRVKLYLLSLIIYVLSFFLFSIFSSFILLILIVIPLAFFKSLRITSFGIIVKDYSKRKNLVKNEGFLYAVENIAWVIGPLIAGYLLSSYGFGFVFFITSLILLFSFFVVRFSKMKDSEIKKKLDGDMMKNFIDFFRNKNRVFAYLLSGGVSVWWSLIYIFVPVYIVEAGFSELLVGYFLFAIAVPLVLGEYYFSTLASRKGFKKIFRIGYFIVGVFSLVCFFIFNIYVLLLILVLASFGMAMLESTTEAYFFDVLGKKQHLRFYGPFNTADTLLGSIARLSSSALLFFLPFKFIFILFSGFMIFNFVLTFFIKDSIESRRR
ncbi:MAG: MFS transporter [Candidatus Pacearchaeota archaeon]|jgi:MFS family permease